MGWKPDHKPIKAKYSPYLSAAERRHERRVRQEPCFGCGIYGVEAHHTMLEFPDKRWRRDHRYRLPVCDDCHRGPIGIHGIGSESNWLLSINRTEDEAIVYVIGLWLRSQESERKAA